MIEVTEHETVTAGSERGFGLVFAGVFAIVAFWPLLHGRGLRWWAAAASIVMLLLAWLRPQSLKLFNVLWFRFGMLLGRIVSPVVSGLVFYLAVTPTGLIMRLRGKDLLGLRFDEQAASYWKVRSEEQVSSMRDQF